MNLLETYFVKLMKSMQFVRLRCWVVGVLCSLISMTAMALSPYTTGDKLTAADLSVQMAAVEKKLQAGGFTVIGRYQPRGLSSVGTVIVVDPTFLQALSHIGGGGAIVGAGIRVGVNTTGVVSYMTPEYWYRAYLRENYGKAEEAVKAVTAKLSRTLGAVALFGGNLSAKELADYQYMVGMERFDSPNSKLYTSASFEDAVKTIRDNLNRQVAETSKVYEVVLPERKIAVFGVAMNDRRGDAHWVTKLGEPAFNSIAGLPYEIFVVDNKVYALYGRYRIALALPSLTMAEFIVIRYTPDQILQTLTSISGAPEVKPFR